MLAYLHALGANLDAGTIRKGRPLEVWVFAGHSGRIELGCADTVGITTGHDRSFATSWTRCCHKMIFLN